MECGGALLRRFCFSCFSVFDTKTEKQKRRRSTAALQTKK
jgi:hypothetical protein